jgi:hypothetical protein
VACSPIPYPAGFVEWNIKIQLGRGEVGTYLLVPVRNLHAAWVDGPQGEGSGELRAEV